MVLLCRSLEVAELVDGEIDMVQQQQEEETPRRMGGASKEKAGSVFLMAYTLPMLYEKYEDQFDVVGEKALIQIKKQYKVLDAKLLSKIPMLSEKKQH
ncbi:hypothetical protein U9M48_043292 [Paspalum notatum var. saurae]|uniref:Reticulon domain-containing protein n=1 Tax=Paspalum notatum var. saurae TaxID=547442 RepID=A0AAQ3XGZ5_PASNO